ncbi:Bug family tripartite tricarboxylate transporter substrate binding protein [Humitalea sp. 24SJ18S-53]|uniref:Bug family tripartite tricarboxylate transporter substrate binding protein n=1 Tax=Humitalea sp. 24SJ18S-53 TaxID=3422307 RepID=UPI003D67AB25
MSPRFSRRALGTSIAALPLPVMAQAWPTRPLRWVVPYAPGGGSDFLARTIAAAISGPLGQTVLVENRPGGATVIATEAVARAAPDGYTVLSADMTALIINPAGFRRLPYDPIKDLKPVCTTATFNFVLAVSPTLAPRSVAELVAMARAQPGRLNFASPGIGSPSHLATERFGRNLNLTLTHVPYRGGAPAVQDLVAGVADAMFIDYASGAPHFEAGRLRPLAATAPTRMSLLPDLQTLAEAGFPGNDIYSWQGVMAPAGTPDAIVARLGAAIRAAVNDPAVADRLRAIGLTPLPGDSASFAALIQSETAIWGTLIRELGLVLDS